ncbi:hypothetical protein [Roseomonas rosulenta]|uniref:hypothetical protein n=1 Tax=Roseomonas rosulenta TaxID=2748667 RepID=UPI0018E02139|nr:hypothetical protein [Roseomonas rosulenta]
MQTTCWRHAALGAMVVAIPALALAQAPKPSGDAAITEMQQQQRANPATPAVPSQNREGARADARDADWVDTRQWLTQARESAAQGNLGSANEFLERAATRMMNRSVEATRATVPMYDLRLRHITLAREAVQRRDGAEAIRQIDLALTTG